MQLERIKVPRESQVKCQVVNKQDSERGRRVEGRGRLRDLKELVLRRALSSSVELTQEVWRLISAIMSIEMGSKEVI